MIRPGSGVIIARRFEDGIKFLGLVSSQEQQAKNRGVYDIPKGVTEKNEDPWMCASRECYEEAGILVREKDIVAGPKLGPYLHIWVCMTNQDPLLLPNPESGILEHDSAVWLEPENLFRDCYNYLRPFVAWAAQSV